MPPQLCVTATSLSPGNIICILVLSRKKTEIGLKPSFTDLLIFLVSCEWVGLLPVSLSCLTNWWRRWATPCSWCSPTWSTPAPPTSHPTRCVIAHYPTNLLQGPSKLSIFLNLVWGPVKYTKSNFNPVHVFLHFGTFCLEVLQLILSSKLSD